MGHAGRPGHGDGGLQPTRREPARGANAGPGKFPNCCANGASGIAVAYATEVPPHQSGRDLGGGFIALIDDPEISPRAAHAAHSRARFFRTGA